MAIYDKDIREPLFEFLEETYGKVRILEEKRIGDSRADVFLVLPTGICGVEIKSDADTYARLAGQVADYDTHFDENIVVVGTSHAAHIREHVPEYWGIITVEELDGRPDFYIYRQPKRETKTTWRQKLEFLWRPELAAIQAKYDMPKYAGKSKAFVIEYIAAAIGERIGEEEMRAEFSRVLFERDYSAIADMINEYRKEHGKKPRRRKTPKLRKRRKTASAAGTRRKKKS